MKKLELYYFSECPYCQIVEHTLQKTGLKKYVTYKNTRENPQFREDLVKVTGRGTVPCLFIDGKPMHESRDISNWLQNYAQELSKAGEV